METSSQDSQELETRYFLVYRYIGLFDFEFDDEEEEQQEQNNSKNSNTDYDSEKSIF
jgi:hypothetical protein